MKKYLAEFIGTLTLTLVVLGSILSQNPFPTAILAGITLTLFVFTLGHISGTHINPAVTVGAYVMKKISKKEAIFYIVSQFLAALVAIIVISIVGKQVPILNQKFTLVSLIAEIIGTGVFTFGIASVVLNKKEEPFAPFIIGGSLAIGASLAGYLGSNGVLNPAVAFGIGSFGFAYIVGPVLGSILGMWLYKKIS